MLLSILMTISLIATAVSGQCLTGNDNPPTMHQGSHLALIESRYVFALDSLKKAAHIQPHDNIFFSPHSIHQALTLAFFGARDSTEVSLKKALHIPEELSKIDIQRYYAFEKSVKQQREQNTSDYEYISANKLWMTDKKKLRECMFDFFGDELEKMDFRSNPSAARKYINDWVSNKTKGHIPDLIPNSGITEDTDLVLANAVYFKGLWQSRFDRDNTKKDIFYASGSQNAMVNYMRQKKTFNHVVSEELGAHVLELPYKGQQISMYILLPPFATARSMNTDANGMDADGITQLIERLSTEKGSKDLRELLNDGMPSREVEVSLPRFQIERELPISELLKALGAEELLAPNTANLKGFVADGEDTLHLGDAVHRAKIEVTEEGTTAAAATALFSFRSSRPSEPAIFKANHPFIYFIYDKQDDAILFSGVYRLPIPATNDQPPVVA